ncbi:hypothetical protein BMS3Abin04_01226 [bacterium BMS3Abin04]|nr:hypothetical protein BMS3Abin04_01226 [bacterium BMS3Abin04]
MLLKTALNGTRSKTENEYLPHSLEEIENEVSLLYKNGCNVFHIHCYDQNGNESLRPEDVNSLVSRIKNISSEIQIGISSGDWIEPDFEKRKRYIKDWDNIPDFISLNIIEENSIEIANLLISKGILVEVGLNEIEAAEIFVGSNLNKGCCRILIEPEEEILDSAINTINEIEKILDSNQITIDRLLHGFNGVSWDILREAKKRGYDSRVGMEDTIYLENGKKVKSNLELIDNARKIINTT